MTKYKNIIRELQVSIINLLSVVKDDPVSDLLYRSPAESLRHQADLLERKEEIITQAIELIQRLSAYPELDINDGEKHDGP